MTKTRKVVASGLVALLTGATLAACGDAPEEENGGSGSQAAASDFLPCIVSDAGGFDDKSFNQLGFEGATQAADELGVELKAVESNSENDFGPNLESLVGEGCDVIVTVGFALAAATKESAAANPDIEYVLIDDSADGGDETGTTGIDDPSSDAGSNGATTPVADESTTSDDVDESDDDGLPKLDVEGEDTAPLPSFPSSDGRTFGTGTGSGRSPIGDPSQQLVGPRARSHRHALRIRRGSIPRASSRPPADAGPIYGLGC